MATEAKQGRLARIAEIEHLHTRTDISFVSETLIAAGYKSETREDGRVMWSNGGCWSDEASAYGMLQYDHIVELCSLARPICEEGDRCPDCGIGRLTIPPVEDCSCHINPPCSQHTRNRLECKECGWEWEGEAA